MESFSLFCFRSGNMTYLCRVGDRDVGVFVVLDDIEESLFPCSGHFLEGGVLEVVHCEGYNQRRGIAVLVVCNVNLEMMMISGHFPGARIFLTKCYNIYPNLF